MNELSILAKFITSTLLSDTYWNTNMTVNGVLFFEEVIPIGINLDTKLAAMFVMIDSTDNKGAFGFRLCTTGIYQIKAICEGSDFSKIEDSANQIDRLFDWTNTFDIIAGRPKCQITFVDPDNPASSIVVMSSIRNKPIKYSMFSDGVNYCNQGGEYQIQYYSN